MAAKAIVRKVFVQPQSFSMMRAFVSPGLMDRRSAVVKGSSVSFCASPEIERRSPEVKAPVPFFAYPEIFSRITKDGGGDVKSGNIKIEDEQQRILHEVEELTNFKRSLLCIQHHHGLGIINFTTAAGIRTLALQRSVDPYGLPRQAVEGVVCITTPAKDAFLLYNPTTGDTSPWIETTTTREVYGGGKARCQVESIGLGFDPESKKHKVICISSHMDKMFAEEDGVDDNDYETLVVEVLTVGDHTWATGEHKWRELVDAPPAYSDGGRFAFVDGPLYVDGKIHWQFHNLKRIEYVLEFDVGTEEFAYTPFGRRLKKDLSDSLQQVRSVMMEVDGNVAILMSTPDDQQTSTLWICHELNKDGGMRWKDEKVLIPYDCLCPDSSIEALTGTDFIFTQSHGRISCYNRKTETPLSPIIPTLSIPDHFDWGRIIKL